jgi:hypothetical protein
MHFPVNYSEPTARVLHKPALILRTATNLWKGSKKKKGGRGEKERGERKKGERKRAGEKERTLERSSLVTVQRLLRAKRARGEAHNVLPSYATSKGQKSEHNN